MGPTDSSTATAKSTPCSLLINTRQGRAWRGACKIFAMLAAEARDIEIRICVNVSIAKKTRIMADKRHLTMACKESSQLFPHLYRQVRNRGFWL